MQTLSWPETPEELEARQHALAAMAADVEPWRPQRFDTLRVAGVFVAMTTGSPGRQVARGDPAWAAAVVMERGRTVASVVIAGRTGAPYLPGYLALQQGPLLEEVVRSLDRMPDVVLVNGTGRDHPRRAGLAVHAGAILGAPTVGVTDRPLVGVGPEPERRRWSVAPLLLDDELVGFRVRTRRRVHPIVVHAGWRTDPEAALEVVRAVTGRARTPEPVRQARRLARTRRAQEEGRPAQEGERGVRG